MAYIKIRIRTRLSDSEGRSRLARIAHFESDMPTASTNELLLITHALSAPGGADDGDRQSGFDYTLDMVLE